MIPDSKVHVANMGPIGGRQVPGGPRVSPINLAIREAWLPVQSGRYTNHCIKVLYTQLNSLLAYHRPTVVVTHNLSSPCNDKIINTGVYSLLRHQIMQELPQRIHDQQVNAIWLQADRNIKGNLIAMFIIFWQKLPGRGFNFHKHVSRYPGVHVKADVVQQYNIPLHVKFHYLS